MSSNKTNKHEEDKPKIDLHKAETFLSMTFESDASENLLYTIRGNVVTIIAGHLSEKDLQELFKENYSLLLSVLQNDELQIEVDIGEFVFPLTIKKLKDISNFYL